MTDLISVTVSDGKYTIQQTAMGRWEALRHGEHWPAMASGPDNLHVALAMEIADLRMKLGYWQRGTDIINKRLTECVKADPSDVPIPLVGDEACQWHAYRGEAYRDALEMMGVPTDFGPVLKGDV